jgi:hypothetical protein
MWIHPVLTVESSAEQRQWRTLQENLLFMLQQLFVDDGAPAPADGPPAEAADAAAPQSQSFFRIVVKHARFPELEALFYRGQADLVMRGGSAKRGRGRAGPSAVAARLSPSSPLAAVDAEDGLSTASHPLAPELSHPHAHSHPHPLAHHPHQNHSQQLQPSPQQRSPETRRRRFFSFLSFGSGTPRPGSVQNQGPSQPTSSAAAAASASSSPSTAAAALEDSHPVRVVAVSVSSVERDIYRHWEWISVHLLSLVNDIEEDSVSGTSASMSSRCELLYRELCNLAVDQNRVLVEDSEETSARSSQSSPAAFADLPTAAIVAQAGAAAHSVQSSSPALLGPVGAAVAGGVQSTTSCNSIRSSGDVETDADVSTPPDSEPDAYSDLMPGGSLFVALMKAFLRDAAAEARIVVDSFDCSLVRGAARRGCMWLTPNALYFSSFSRTTQLMIPLVSIMMFELKDVGAGGVPNTIILETTMGEYMFDDFQPYAADVWKCHVLLKRLWFALCRRVAMAFEERVSELEDNSESESGRGSLSSSGPVRRRARSYTLSASAAQNAAAAAAAVAAAASLSPLRGSDNGEDSRSSGLPLPVPSSASPYDDDSGFVFHTDDILRSRKLANLQHRFRLPQDEFAVYAPLSSAMEVAVPSGAFANEQLLCRLHVCASALLVWCRAKQLQVVLLYSELQSAVLDDDMGVCAKLRVELTDGGGSFTFTLEPTEDFSRPYIFMRSQIVQSRARVAAARSHRAVGPRLADRSDAPLMFDLLADPKQFPEDYLQRTADRFEQWNDYFRLYGRGAGMLQLRPLLNAYSFEHIPDQYRGSLWMDVSGARLAMEMHPGHYAELVARLDEVPEEAVDQIEKDVPRTFPDHPFFQNEGAAILRRLLLAYALHNLDVVYCQGMNYIAAVFVSFLGECEAFWLLDVVIRVMLPDYHSGSMSGAVVDQWVFAELLERYLPEVSASVKRISQQYLPAGQNLISCISFSWFLTAFASWLPMESALAVLTLLLVQGRTSVLLFQVGLAIMKIKAKSLETCETIPNARMLSEGVWWSDLSAMITRDFAGLTHKEVQRLRRAQTYHLMVQQIQQVNLPSASYEYHAPEVPSPPLVPEPHPALVVLDDAEEKEHNFVVPQLHDKDCGTVTSTPPLSARRFSSFASLSRNVVRDTSGASAADGDGDGDEDFRRGATLLRTLNKTSTALSLSRRGELSMLNLTAAVRANKQKSGVLDRLANSISVQPEDGAGAANLLSFHGARVSGASVGGRLFMVDSIVSGDSVKLAGVDGDGGLRASGGGRAKRLSMDVELPRLFESASKPAAPALTRMASAMIKNDPLDRMRPRSSMSTRRRPVVLPAAAAQPAADGSESAGSTVSVVTVTLDE